MLTKDFKVWSLLTFSISILSAFLLLGWILASLSINFDWMKEIDFTLSSGLGGELGMRLQDGATRRGLGGTVLHWISLGLGNINVYPKLSYFFGAFGSILALLIAFRELSKLIHPIDAFLCSTILPFGASMYISTGGNFARRDGILFVIAYLLVLLTKLTISRFSRLSRTYVLAIQCSLLVIGILIHEVFLFYYVPCLLLVAALADRYGLLSHGIRDRYRLLRLFIIRSIFVVGAALFALSHPHRIRSRIFRSFWF